jgi:3-phenylpropionate/cinnamic acid dioxygenase small subunit
MAAEVNEPADEEANEKSRPSDAAFRRVSDELEIRNLIARIARLTDDGDPDDYAGCFAEDGSWVIPDAPRHGRPDIREGLVVRRNIKACGPESNARHLVTTVVVTADGSDTASAESTWLYCTELRKGPIVRATGRYFDDLSRTGSGWQVARRQVVTDTTG